MTPLAAGKDDRLRWCCDPPQHIVCCRASRATRARHAQLDERDKAPVRAHPLLVWVHAKTSVGKLSGEETIDHRFPPRHWTFGSGRYSHSMVPGGLLVMS